ncbi:MAG: hypothetical protein ASUL_01085 [Candidatus Aramenus sulfurataquae]|uniref:Uncharacterized protein n=1 Tax=Candidatus Aramenus sulfurataquae TaxID=1326980 RepID=W7KLF6_9CREN|nr:MAG: hypothetical protein ASUL_01085 [Candidatus Aramenus sulfurataquae]
MIAKNRMAKLYEEIEKVQKGNLSITEQGILNFLKDQIKMEEDVLSQFEKNYSENKSSEAITSFMTLVQRANVMFYYLVQPTVLSSFTSGKMEGLVQELIDALTFAVSEATMMIKSMSKGLGIDSLTVSLNSNPPSISVSMVFKSA